MYHLDIFTVLAACRRRGTAFIRVKLLYLARQRLLVPVAPEVQRAGRVGHGAPGGECTAESSKEPSVHTCRGPAESLNVRCSLGANTPSYELNSRGGSNSTIPPMQHFEIWPEGPRLCPIYDDKEP